MLNILFKHSFGISFGTPSCNYTWNHEHSRLIHHFVCKIKTKVVQRVNDYKFIVGHHLRNPVDLHHLYLVHLHPDGLFLFLQDGNSKYLNKKLLALSWPALGLQSARHKFVRVEFRKFVAVASHSCRKSNHKTFIFPKFARVNFRMSGPLSPRDAALTVSDCSKFLQEKI
jgi:hypothetical protein